MAVKKSPPQSLHVRAALRRQGVRPGDTILAAVSGGPDSMALFHLLSDERTAFPFRVAIAHFNHRLRSSAGADEAFVRGAARRAGLPYFSGRRDVKAYARAHRLNVEEAGRLLRYAFLEKAAARAGANFIATGHTMNDQAETVLMRMLRGTGLTGLAGIPAIGDRSVIRPLIGLIRKDILGYLKARGIAYREDETNRDTTILRNRVRLKLIPYLQKTFGVSVVRPLARLAAIAGEDDAFLDEIARGKTGRGMIKGRGAGAELNAAALTGFPKALARRIVRVFLRELKGDLRDISFEDVESILTLSDGGEIALSKGLVLERRGNSIGRKKRRSRPAPFAFVWDGRDTLPAAGLSFAGRFLSKKQTEETVAGLFPKEKKRASKTSMVGRSTRAASRKARRSGLPDNATGCLLDADALAFPLLVRSRRPGDRYRPLGAPGRAKLSEIMRAKGIPASERDRRPIFFWGDEIIWAPGVPVAEKFKVTPKTKRLFSLRIES